VAGGAPPRVDAGCRLFENTSLGVRLTTTTLSSPGMARAPAPAMKAVRRWNARLVPWAGFTLMLGVLSTGCGVHVQPPSAPYGFLHRPDTNYAGVLTISGSASVGRRDHIAITYPTADAAVVQIAPACSLRAGVTVPAYEDVPGKGVIRQPDGFMKIDQAGACALPGLGAATVDTGTVKVSDAGAVDLSVAGADSQGTPFALRFTGTLTQERDPIPDGEKTIGVHFLAQRSWRLSKGETAFAPELQRRESEDDRWSSVCTAPCVAHINPSTELRVSGTGIAESSPFMLPPGRDRIAIKAAGTSAGARAFGWMFTAVGLVPVGVGAAFAVAGATGSERERPLVAVGGLAALTGIPFIAIGVASLLRSGTHVVTDRGEELPLPASDSASLSGGARLAF